MAILSVLFFAGVLATAAWAIVGSFMPRRDYVVALLTGSVAAPAPVLVAQHRRVRRLTPLSFHSELRALRAAA